MVIWYDIYAVVAHQKLKVCFDFSLWLNTYRYMCPLGLAHGKTTLTLNVKVQRRTCVINVDAENDSVERRYNPATTLIDNIV